MIFQYLYEKNCLETIKNNKIHPINDLDRITLQFFQNYKKDLELVSVFTIELKTRWKFFS